MIQKIAIILYCHKFIVFPHISWLTFIATPIGDGHWGSTPPSVQDFCWKQRGKRRIREEEETLYESALHQPLILTLLQRLFAVENAQFSCMFVHFSIDLNKFREVQFMIETNKH